MKLDLSYTICKNKLKMIKYLKVRPEPVKLEENARGKVHDIGFGNDFFGHQKHRDQKQK